MEILYRGATLAEEGMNKITGDHIGMLATVMNALALSDAFDRHKIPSMVMSGFSIGGGVCEPLDHKQANRGAFRREGSYLSQLEQEVHASQLILPQPLGASRNWCRYSL